MSRIELLMLHCAATPEGRDFTEEQIRAWFTSRGWKNPGYRQITHLDGTITVLQESDHDEFLERGEYTNGAIGFNHKSIHLSYIGGCDRDWKPKDTRTREQLDSLESQVKGYLYLYPWIKVLGHNQVSSKACPSFDVAKWSRSIGIPERNIFSDDVFLSCSTSEYLFDLDHDFNGILNVR